MFQFQFQRSLLPFVVIGLVTTATTQAYTFDEVNIQYWTGSGPDEAASVVDFGANVFVFGYRWDSGVTSPTGRDMLNDIAANGALDVVEQNFGFGFFVSELDYLAQPFTGANGYPSDWWSYFISTDGAAWALSNEGHGDRLLSDGDWDGWALQTTGDFPPLHIPAIPEPTTLALMGLTAFALRRR